MCRNCNSPKPCTGADCPKAVPRLSPSYATVSWLGANWAGVPLVVRLYASRRPGGLPPTKQAGCGCMIRSRRELDAWVKSGLPWRKRAAQRLHRALEFGSWAWSWGLDVWLLLAPPSPELRPLLASCFGPAKAPVRTTTMRGTMPQTTQEESRELQRLMAEAARSGRSVTEAVKDRTRALIHQAGPVKRSAATASKPAPEPSKTA